MMITENNEDNVLEEVKERMDTIEEIASTSIINADNSMRQHIRSTVEETIAQMDKNKDGIISLGEAVSFGKETLNGEGFKTLLVTLGTLIFNYLWNYALDAWFTIDTGNPFGFIGSLVVAAIMIYSFKGTTAKIERNYSKVLASKDGKIKNLEKHNEELKQDKQADRLAIEILRHDAEKDRRVIEDLRQENEKLKTRLKKK